MQPQKPLIEQTSRTTPLQPLSNDITANRTNYDLWTTSQQQKNTDLTIRKSLRKAQKSQNYSPTRPSNNVLMQRLINLWDALQCPQQERDYAYSEILREPALANEYARTMRQILFHRRRFDELQIERDQLAENIRTTLQAGRGSKRALLADLIKLRVMTLELFSLMNSARRFSARPIDLPSLEVVEFSQVKKVYTEAILTRENLSVAFCVMRFIDGNYDEVSAQVNKLFDDLIVQGSSDEEIQIAFLLGSNLLGSTVAVQFQKFLVRKFDEIFEVKLEKYEPKDYVKPAQVLEMIKSENKGYNQYIKLVQQLQSQEMEICTVPIHHSEKSHDAYSLNVEYLKDVPAEEIKQVRKNFNTQLYNKFQDKNSSKLDERVLQMSQGKQQISNTAHRPVLNTRNNNIIKQQEKQREIPPVVEIVEEPIVEQQLVEEYDIPITLEEPMVDDGFEDTPVDIPTTLEEPIVDEFEEEQHVPATLEEPIIEDGFEEETIQPIPFENNADDIILYENDNKISQNNQLLSQDDDFEDTPIIVPITMSVKPEDDGFEDTPADVPATVDFEDFEEEQHVPATLEEPIIDDGFEEEEHVPTTLQEPIVDDEFEEEQHVPTTLEEPIVDDGFEEETVQPRAVITYIEPFESNVDDVISYDDNNVSSAKQQLLQPENNDDFEDTPIIVPTTMSAKPTDDDFEEEEQHVPVTLQEPIVDDSFEEEQHIPATLEEPIIDDGFEEEPVQPRSVITFIEPFENNVDEVISYDDGKNQSSAKQLISQADNNDDFEDTPIIVPTTMSVKPEDDGFEDTLADVPATIEEPIVDNGFEEEHVPTTLQEPIIDDEFEEEQHVPATLEEPIVDAFEEETVQPRAVITYIEPFESNIDDIISYDDNKISNVSAAKQLFSQENDIVAEAPAVMCMQPKEDSFEDTPANAPAMMRMQRAQPQDDGFEQEQHMPATMDLKPQDDGFEQEQHMPATMDLKPQDDGFEQEQHMPATMDLKPQDDGFEQEQHMPATMDLKPQDDGFEQEQHMPTTMDLKPQDDGFEQEQHMPATMDLKPQDDGFEQQQHMPTTMDLKPQDDGFEQEQHMPATMDLKPQDDGFEQEQHMPTTMDLKPQDDDGFDDI